MLSSDTSILTIYGHITLDSTPYQLQALERYLQDGGEGGFSQTLLGQLNPTAKVVAPGAGLT